MDDDAELQLVREAQAGSPHAFASLVDRYWGRIYRWLFGLIHSRHTAEDLTQEVFLRAWKQMPSLKSATAFRPWLFRIARNCFHDVKKSPASSPLRQLPADLRLPLAAIAKPSSLMFGAAVPRPLSHPDIRPTVSPSPGFDVAAPD